jgi:hypothetical protein
MQRLRANFGGAAVNYAFLAVVADARLVQLRPPDGVDLGRHGDQL